MFSSLKWDWHNWLWLKINLPKSNKTPNVAYQNVETIIFQDLPRIQLMDQSWVRLTHIFTVSCLLLSQRFGCFHSYFLRPWVTQESWVDCPGTRIDGGPPKYQDRGILQWLFLIRLKQLLAKGMPYSNSYIDLEKLMCICICFKHLVKICQKVAKYPMPYLPATLPSDHPNSQRQGARLSRGCHRWWLESKNAWILCMTRNPQTCFFWDAWGVTKITHPEQFPWTW